MTTSERLGDPEPPLREDGLGFVKRYGIRRVPVNMKCETTVQLIEIGELPAHVVVFEVLPGSGGPWYFSLTFDPTFSGLTGYFGTPSPTHALVVWAGSGAIVDVLQPQRAEHAVVPCITGIAADASQGYLALAGSHDVAIYSRSGLEYLVENLSIDGVEVQGMDGTVLTGACRDAATDAEVSFRFDAQSGQLEGGSAIAIVRHFSTLRMVGSHAPRRWSG